jgi:hypothetical protein
MSGIELVFLYEISEDALGRKTPLSGKSLSQSVFTKYERIYDECTARDKEQDKNLCNQPGEAHNSEV